MYDEFPSLEAARHAYRRRRTVQHFILTDNLSLVLCACCGKKLDDYGDTPEGYCSNRCEYYPRGKSIKAMHYTCAWDMIFEDIVALREVCTS